MATAGAMPASRQRQGRLHPVAAVARRFLQPQAWERRYVQEGSCVVSCACTAAERCAVHELVPPQAWERRYVEEASCAVVLVLLYSCCAVHELFPRQAGERRCVE